ncbi:MAG TPA: alpha/beta fold hydrolase [Candidatus Saccharimonadaceae bacterium]|nr:alpha/beta fold hydrolase [Candidatus Saccharimonadaceae bacterium]
MPTVLMVPGFTGASPGHWQSLWIKERPEYRRVEQRDWDAPEAHEWVDVLDRAVIAAPAPVVLVGHSLGCITIVRWAAERATFRAGAALLVAACDVEADTAPSEVRGFAPIPLGRLPFPSVLVTSSTDPLATETRSAEFARGWGSRIVAIGDAGHIHTAAGFGPWPEGHRLLHDLLATCA